VAELIIVDGSLEPIILDGSDDVERLEGYLGDRWGIQSNLPTSHRYASQPPLWYLKPTHRWQMPAPRNLLDDPENFDPSSTEWREYSSGVYVGPVDNVGPNGEQAYELDLSIGNFRGLTSRYEEGSFIHGAFVRAKSGTASFQIRSRVISGTDTQTNFSIGTGWQWVVHSFVVDTDGAEAGGPLFLGDSPVYILRTQFNRGSQLAPYTTDQSVPQTIPEVVQGADLSNGSTDSADTNDLDFGIDSEGSFYAVSDGDDLAEKISDTSDFTYVARFYVGNAPSGKVGEINIADENHNYLRIYYNKGGGSLWRVEIVDDSGSSHRFLGDLGIDKSEVDQKSYTLAVTIEKGNLLRFHGPWGVNEWDISNISFTPSDWRPIDISSTNDTVGNVVPVQLTNVEIHPVLSEAEAEAVRQRLATNPSDPVVPTERWDLSAETSPHNWNRYSENFDPSTTDWGNVSNGALQNNSTIINPNGETGVGAFSEDSTYGQRVFEYKTDIFYPKGNWVTRSVWVKPSGRNWVSVRIRQANTLAERYFDIQNISLGGWRFQQFTDQEADIIDVGGGWAKCIVRAKMPNLDSPTSNNYVRRPAIRLASGDGTSQYQGDGSSGIYVWGAQIVKGRVANPTYVKTEDSIAFPQTVPAQRDSANDLTVGSTTSADTNDPDWVASKGIGFNGGDDYLKTPDFGALNTFTMVFRVNLQASGQDQDIFTTGGHSGGSDLLLWYDGSNDAWALLSNTISGDGVKNDDIASASINTFTTLIVRYDGQEMTAFVNGSKELTTPLSDSIDLNSGHIGNSGAPGKPLNGIVSDFEIFTRALTDEEALYARQRILDNPDSRIPLEPDYSTPSLSQPTIDSTTVNSDDTLTINYS
jgi:hypothetical protein